MKSASGNKFWVPTLMIFSVVLLTAFVSQWLVGQYSEAEKMMEKDVRADLKKTGDQLVDSLLTQFITLPVGEQLDTTVLSHLEHLDHTIVRNSDEPKKQKAIVNISMTSSTSVSSGKPVVHEIRREFSQKGDQEKKMVMITASDSNFQFNEDFKPLVTKGIGVFIKKLASQSDGSFKGILNKPIDEKLTQKLLAKNWQTEGLDYQLVFPGKKKKTKPKNLVTVTNQTFPIHLSVALPNRISYLSASLLPQFLFSFLLVLVTTLAFWLTYRSLRKQRQLYELRTDFVNNISHELKTPVSTVKVAVEALQQFNRRTEPEVMDEYLQLMKLEMNRLDKLINQVLTSAMMDESQTFLQTRPTDLVPLVKSVIAGFQWQLNQSGAKIEFHPSTDSAMVSGDQTHIEGVLLNLLDNCLKYAGENPTIRIGLFASTKQVEITVADEGPGIPTEYVNQLFDKFFRVPTGNEHNVKGYGLGLSYCKQVMEHHRGSISVENLAEKGCLFRLTFPLLTK